MHAFAGFAVCGLVSADHGSEIAALGDVACGREEADHEVVEGFGGVVDSEIEVFGWIAGVGVPGDAGDDDMVGEGFWGVFLLQEIEDLEEFEERAWPAVVEG